MKQKFAWSEISVQNRSNICNLTKAGYMARLILIIMESMRLANEAEH